MPITGSGYDFPVMINGKDIRSIDEKTYFKIIADPGRIVISSQLKAGLTRTLTTPTINAEQGKNYFIYQEIKHGLVIPSIKLHEIRPDIGTKIVLKYKLTKTISHTKKTRY
jgi:hypothetical protein